MHRQQPVMALGSLDAVSGWQRTSLIVGSHNQQAQVEGRARGRSGLVCIKAQRAAVGQGAIARLGPLRRLRSDRLPQHQESAPLLWRLSGLTLPVTGACICRRRRRQPTCVAAKSVRCVQHLWQIGPLRSQHGAGALLQAGPAGAAHAMAPQHAMCCARLTGQPGCAH